MMKNTLDQAKKDAIVTIYKAGTRTIHQLAHQCGVSRSTIRRVLNEAGVYTPEQTERSKGEMALAILSERGITVGQLGHELAKARAPLDRGALVKLLMDLSEDDWQSLLSEVITARVAKAHNVHTSSAMLRVQEKVDKNARDSEG